MDIIMKWYEIIEALEAIESRSKKDLLAKAAAEIRRTRNELCLMCGKYMGGHCEGCRWRDDR